MTPWLDDGDVQLHHGDVIQTLRELPAGIAQTCITSPPYWGLRDYGTGEWTGGDEDCHHQRPANQKDASSTLGTPGHMPGVNTHQNHSREPWPNGECGRCGARRVDSQLGLEATPDLYVERLVAVFREVWRVLRADGTVWLNLGDSYVATQGGRQHAIGELPKGGRAAKPSFGVPADRSDVDVGGWSGRNVQGKTVPPASSGLKPKDLVGIPWKVAFALQADGWYLRSDIVWSKPNPMPESVVDRPTKAHEYLFLLAKQPRYFYDADAIREQGEGIVGNRREFRGGCAYTGSHSFMNGSPKPNATPGNDGITAGRNRRSVWTIPTEPFPEAHFATYPQALVRPCILAGTSERGECSSCGAPWVRETEQTRRYIVSEGGSHADGTYRVKYSDTPHDVDFRERRGDGDGFSMNKQRWHTQTETTGWRASCACDAPTRPQTVIDPFIGSGTTALVARNHGRRCIGIDLSAEYLAIAAKRLQQLSLLGELA